MAIPNAILLKPSALNHAEWEVMHTHGSIGAEVIELLYIADAKEIAKTVKQHHEHVDGSDYPDGLNGVKTSIIALNRALSFCQKLSPDKIRF